MHRWVRCCKKHNLSRPLCYSTSKSILDNPSSMGFHGMSFFLASSPIWPREWPLLLYVCVCIRADEREPRNGKRLFISKEKGGAHWHSLCTKLKSKRWMHFSRLDGEECSTSILAGNYVTYFHACVSTNRHKWIYHVARLIKLQLQQQSQLREKEKN